jgi:hypothetical protein
MRLRRKVSRKKGYMVEQWRAGCRHHGAGHKWKYFKVRVSAPTLFGLDLHFRPWQLLFNDLCTAHDSPRFHPVKNFASLAMLDGAFQLQEYISLLIRLDVHDVDAMVSPEKRKSRPTRTWGERRRKFVREGEERSYSGRGV